MISMSVPQTPSARASTRAQAGSGAGSGRSSRRMESRWPGAMVRARICSPSARLGWARSTAVGALFGGDGLRLAAERDAKLVLGAFENPPLSERQVLARAVDVEGQ